MVWVEDERGGGKTVQQIFFFFPSIFFKKGDGSRTLLHRENGTTTCVPAPARNFSFVFDKFIKGN